MSVPQRRIDDRLRKLSAKALAASDKERESILQELLELVHRKGERLKRRAARLLLKGEELEGERRTTDLKDQPPKSGKTSAQVSERDTTIQPAKKKIALV